MNYAYIITWKSISIAERESEREPNSVDYSSNLFNHKMNTIYKAQDYRWNYSWKLYGATYWIKNFRFLFGLNLSLFLSLASIYQFNWMAGFGKRPAKNRYTYTQSQLENVLDIFFFLLSIQLSALWITIFSPFRFIPFHLFSIHFKKHHSIHSTSTD